MKNWIGVLLAVIGLGAAGQSLTQNDADITATLNAFRVESVAGKETLKPATTAKVGDLVEYQAEYRNNGKTSAKNMDVGVPIPPGMEYVPGSAKPADVYASLDGQRFAPVPLMRKVKGQDGKDKVDPVPVSDYRALRWRIAEIKPRSAVQLTLRMRLSWEGSTPPPDARK